MNNELPLTPPSPTNPRTFNVGRSRQAPRSRKDKSLSRNPERDYCLLLLMVRHGLRVSEAVNLKLSDVDLQGKVMHVKRLKNGISTTHPLYNGEVKAIKDWMVKRQEMSLDALTLGAGNTLFISERQDTALAQQRLQDGQHLCQGCGTIGTRRSPSYVAAQLRVRSGEPRR